MFVQHEVDCRVFSIFPQMSKVVASSLCREDAVNEYRNTGATFQSTFINVMNTIIGAGILSIPYSIHGTGLIGSFLLLVVACLFSICGAYFLIVAAVYTKKDSYGDIGQILYGTTIRTISIITLILYEVGVSTAYSVILFEQVLDLLGTWGGFSSVLLWKNRWVGRSRRVDA